MANVYTKKFHRARTTTLRDFTNKTETITRLPRILSPTRRINPHPKGLVRQSPYNKDNTAFDIWQPSPITTKTTFPLMIEHLGRVNFSSGPIERLLNAHAPKGIPPEIEYAMDS
ncbi:uncharacterized protein LOC141909262, partial [Tubulanus polymorphus]|uniref:uncharacterized protein LOC141909262 n=1 Tax=Tubulanus polymorphus TaxID=672921 RepID=UPI003DA240FC